WIPNYANVLGGVPASFPAGFETTRPEFGYVDSRGQWVPTAAAYPGLSDEYGNGSNNHAGADFRDPNANGYAYRGSASAYPDPKPHPEGTAWTDRDGLISVPYQWGTTGIGYRTDVFRSQDIEALGWDVFALPSYPNPQTSRSYDLRGKMMLLDDVHEAFTAALKAAGWRTQESFLAHGLTDAPPTAITRNGGATGASRPPTYADPPFHGDFQWSGSEGDVGRLEAARDWLLTARDALWGFNTVQQGPWLVTGTVLADQAWPRDVMYAVRPNTDEHLPVDYLVPRQGSSRWVDAAVIHRSCEKLWLAHEFVNYLLDPAVGEMISDWNLSATPNAWSFELLHQDPRYGHVGQYPDARAYYWNPAEDHRIYADLAFATPAPYALDPDFVAQVGSSLSEPARTYNAQGRPPILERCEMQKDIGGSIDVYRRLWSQVR
ncbi:MAG: hypothetical protein ACT4OI_02670, partial [Methanobacteriota archaeon]